MSYIATTKEVQEHPVGNVEQLLQGKVKGLNIQNANSVPVLREVVIACNENAKFKTKFFSSIAIAEKYTVEHSGGLATTIKDSEFLAALKFIAKYAPVSINISGKNTTGYADLNLLQADKAKWLQWYNANKCSNLSYPKTKLARVD